jgi:hypothetical protein
MSPKDLLPLAITLMLAQLLVGGGWQHARSYDPRLDRFGVAMRSPMVVVAPLHVSDWVVDGLQAEAAAGALQDPAIGP